MHFLLLFLCWQQVYSNLEGNRAHVVNTAWAISALIDAGQVCIKFYFMTCFVDKGSIACDSNGQF